MPASLLTSKPGARVRSRGPAPETERSTRPCRSGKRQRTFSVGLNPLIHLVERELSICRRCHERHTVRLARGSRSPSARTSGPRPPLADSQAMLKEEGRSLPRTYQAQSNQVIQSGTAQKLHGRTSGFSEELQGPGKNVSDPS